MAIYLAILLFKSCKCKQLNRIFIDMLLQYYNFLNINNYIPLPMIKKRLAVAFSNKMLHEIGAGAGINPS
jgi:hypothetical protein